MKPTFCIAVLSAILFGIFWAKLPQKPLITIAERKLQLAKNYSPQKALLHLSVLLCTFATGTIFGFANIMRVLNHETDIISIIAALLLQISGFMALTIAGRTIVKPRSLLELNFFGFAQISKTANKIINLALFILWLVLIIFLGSEFEALNGVVIGSAALLSCIGIACLIVTIAAFGFCLIGIIMIIALIIISCKLWRKFF